LFYVKKTYENMSYKYFFKKIKKMNIKNNFAQIFFIEDYY
jgi:hypothetical protein